MTTAKIQKLPRQKLAALPIERFPEKKRSVDCHGEKKPWAEVEFPKNCDFQNNSGVKSRI
jgi:hypothetical protein